MYTKKQHLKESNVNKKDNKNKNTDTTPRTTSLMATKKYTDFYIVIDFEATCEEPNPPGYFHEIIEFPAVLVDAQTLEIVCVISLFVVLLLFAWFFFWFFLVFFLGGEGVRAENRSFVWRTFQRTPKIHYYGGCEFDPQPPGHTKNLKTVS